MGAFKGIHFKDPTQAAADPRCEWVSWDAHTPAGIARVVMEFEPLNTPAGRAAEAWLKEEARADVFTVTYLLVGPRRLEGFITCRVSEAILTWKGIESLGGTSDSRKMVPAYLLCWCAKHRNAEIEGEELVLNAIRLGRELRDYGCSILALDPFDDESSERVWQRKHGFRLGAVPEGDSGTPRLWLPLTVD
jgi:hypothetical protein